MTFRHYAIIAAVVAAYVASTVGLVHAGEPRAVWLYCTMLGMC